MGHDTRYVLKLGYRCYALPEGTSGRQAGQVIELMRGAEAVDDLYSTNTDIPQVKREHPGKRLEVSLLVADLVVPPAPETEVAPEPEDTPKTPPAPKDDGDPEDTDDIPF